MARLSQRLLPKQMVHHRRIGKALKTAWPRIPKEPRPSL
jgi:hypothetical protein